MKNNVLKKVLATVMASTMVLGASMTVMAEGTAQEATGTGTFEGVEPELPEVTSVTLPTASSAASYFNFTADPAGLMRKYGGSEVTATLPEEAKDTGIYFATADNKFAAKSQELSVTNENARPIDVTVSIAVAGDDYDDMTFASSGTWEAEDKENEIYLAVAEKDADPDNKAVLNGSEVSSLTMQIAGTESNYEVKRTVTDGKASYAYALKTGDLTWESAAFYAEGAINKNAEWKDETVTAPSIKVTWDWVAHVDGPVATPGSMSTSAKSAAISGLAEGVTLKSAKVIKADNSAVTMTASTQYTYTNNTFAIVNGKEVLLDNTKYQKFVLTYSDDSEVEIPIVAAD